jgi:hypothetical protein
VGRGRVGHDGGHVRRAMSPHEGFDWASGPVHGFGQPMEITAQALVLVITFFVKIFL